MVRFYDQTCCRTCSTPACHAFLGGGAGRDFWRNASLGAGGQARGFFFAKRLTFGDKPQHRLQATREYSNGSFIQGRSGDESVHACVCVCICVCERCKHVWAHRLCTRHCAADPRLPPPVFTEDLFVMAPNWKHPECSTVGERAHEM